MSKERLRESFYIVSKRGNQEENSDLVIAKSNAVCMAFRGISVRLCAHLKGKLTVLK